MHPLVLAPLAVLVLHAPAAAAEPVEHRLRIEPAEGPSGGRLVVPRFDAALGWLDRVELEATLDARAALAYESLIEAPSVLEVSLLAVASVRGPGGVTLLQLAGESEYSRVLGAYDGVLDFDGASGGRLGDLALHLVDSHGQAGDGAWSTLAAAGPVVLGLALDVELLVEPQGALVVERRLAAALDVLVRYVYTPWEDVEDQLGLAPDRRELHETLADDRRRPRLA